MLKKLIGKILLIFFPTYAEKLLQEIHEEYLINELGFQKDSLQFKLFKDREFVEYINNIDPKEFNDKFLK